MVDRDLVTRKLAMIVDDLRAVTPIAAKRLDDYLASPTDEVLTERYLERRDIPEYLRLVHVHVEASKST